ncbi:MAG TPA: DUF1015 domain-containing protein [Nitrospiria bacterium]|nr:DUF1015 domain-containing protein [Nitrospiria bacterium]
MAVLLPFQGVRYNTNKVKDLRKVVCPPYDVINAQAQDRYYHNHEYNIIRVELGKENPEDSPTNNRYTRAASFLKDWVKQGVLQRDRDPSMYLYKLDYVLPSKEKKTLRGFFSLVQLEEIGKGRIFPHEFTFPKAKQDRLRLMRTCHANPSPIFMLYSDPAGDVIAALERSVDEARPLVDFIGEEEIRHRLWKISTPSVLNAVSDSIKDHPLFIADGHHRYETALNFMKEMREKDPSPGPKPYEAVFIFCSNMDDAGISLLPIHRVIMNPLPCDLRTLKQRLARSFDVTHLDFNNATESQVRKKLLDEMSAAGRSAVVFGMYAKSENAFHLLKLKPELAPKTSKALEALDVSIFQKDILEGALGITDPAAKKENQIQFVKDEEAAVKTVQSGSAGLAFFLNPTKIGQVRDVVLVGDRMPQKSTYFYPKPLTGLVLNKF